MRLAHRRGRLRLSVAPMMDWTDTHCRVFHRLLAPHARLYTEMVHANAVIHGDRTRLLAMDPVEHPVALQLGGSEPDAARASRAHRRRTRLRRDQPQLRLSVRSRAGRSFRCVPDARTRAGRRQRRRDGRGVRRPGDGEVPARRRRRPRLRSLPRLHRHRCRAPAARMFVVHARNAWLKGLSPKENREVPPLRYDWAYRVEARAARACR